MGYTNMQFDIMVLNMESQLADIAYERWGKRIDELTNGELYVVVLVLCKRILAVSERNVGEKKLYYLSAEFMPGRLLINNLINLELYDRLNSILHRYGKDLAMVEEAEPEPSLGSGGLGRLASCFLDSLATMGLPADGIGLNYHYGQFRQKFVNHTQTEEPDPWIQPESWEIPTETGFDVQFGDRMVRSRMYDMDVVGYRVGAGKLHLFDMESVKESLVRSGVEFDKNDIDENLTLFLYPDDSDAAGRKLRLYQEYFLASNAAQFILEEMKSMHYDLRHLYDYAVIQINDTFPTLIIPELIRVLVRDKALTFPEAVAVVSKTCAYTNHNVLRESIERWPVRYLMRVIPQLMPVIRELDNIVRRKYDNPEVYIIDENDMVRMAAINIHFSFSVNGVTDAHTEILKRDRLHAFYEIYRDKFNSKTNGISFRRWLMTCNPELTSWITKKIGDGFKMDALQLEKLLDFVDDTDSLESLGQIRTNSKVRLTKYIQYREGIQLDPDGIFDIQIKSFHEYKRQQMNALAIIHKYLEVKAGHRPVRPINWIFGGKAPHAYVAAQDILHLLLCLQDLINNDPDVNKYLHLAVVSNYNVSYAQKLIPACDVSEQISLASREASGTVNMKQMLNGAVTLGTADGANLEISRLVGRGNIYLFGLEAKAVLGYYHRGDYVPKSYYDRSPVVKRAVDFLLSPELLALGDETRLRRLYDGFLTRDTFMALVDLDDYIRVRDTVYRDYRNRTGWQKKMLTNIAKAGYFSSDRAVAEYNRDIWKLPQYVRPGEV